MKIPDVLLKYADALEEKTKKVYPPLAPLAKRCFLNTMETTVKECDNGDFFVITGDIPAMWLRDSASQLRQYMPLCAESETLREIMRGVIRRHVFYVNLDPYANAFNMQKQKDSWKDETDFSSELIWERKYEVDSLCASVYLIWDYYTATKEKSIFTDELKNMLVTVLNTFIREQNHSENSSYYFIRKDCPETDTIPQNGKGNPVGFTGMTWSGFRPSDDRCKYNYLIPANMMASVAMQRAEILFRDIFSDAENADRCQTLYGQINEGIENFGTVIHEKYGKIYAYETDGLGHHLLMDDANAPSLLSLPYIGWCDKNDPVYLNTRKFILSKDNPFYFEGKAAKGIGSPHTGKDAIWHISLIMQILTATNEKEKAACLETLSQTHAGTCFMHESFHKDDASEYSRSWFAWANSLFSYMLEKI